MLAGLSYVGSGYVRLGSVRLKKARLGGLIRNGCVRLGEGKLFNGVLLLARLLGTHLLQASIEKALKAYNGFRPHHDPATLFSHSLFYFFKFSCALFSGKHFTSSYQNT